MKNSLDEEMEMLLVRSHYMNLIHTLCHLYVGYVYRLILKKYAIHSKHWKIQQLGTTLISNLLQALEDSQLISLVYLRSAKT